MLPLSRRIRCTAVTFHRAFSVKSDFLLDIEKTLIVKHVPRLWNWQELKDIMKTYGNVRSVGIHIDANKVRTGTVIFDRGTDTTEVLERFQSSEVYRKNDLKAFPCVLPNESEHIQDIGTSRLRVSNLTPKASYQSLKGHFENIGCNVHSVNFIVDDEVNATGAAIVVFDTSADASKAMHILNDFPFAGKALKLRPDVMFDEQGAPVPVRDEVSEDGTPEEGVKLFVHNLQFEVGWKELKDHFRQAGEVVRADIMKDERGRSKGAGFVVMRTQEAAVRALKLLHMSKLGSRSVFVRLDRKKEALVLTPEEAARRVLVDNIPLKAARAEVFRHIKAVAWVEEFAMSFHGDRQRAEVMFKTPEDAKLVVEVLHESMLLDSMLIVSPNEYKA